MVRKLVPAKTFDGKREREGLVFDYCWLELPGESLVFRVRIFTIVALLGFAGLLKSRVVFGANIEALAAREKSRVPVIMSGKKLRLSSSDAAGVPGWDCHFKSGDRLIDSFIHSLLCPFSQSFVVRCTSALESRDALRVDGIYRINGNTGKLMV